jgi:CRP-like cAMP-binding protein
MDNEQLKTILTEMRFTEGMSSTTMQHLARIAELELIKAGTVLFREGSQNGDLYLIREGKIALEINVPGRGKSTILTVGPGEFVGWLGLVDDTKMMETAVAVEDTEVLRASGKELNSICDEDHEFCHHLLRSLAQALSERLVATRLQMLDLFAEENNR